MMEREEDDVLDGKRKRIKATENAYEGPSKKFLGSHIL
jgi:hypothetical protein